MSVNKKIYVVVYNDLESSFGSIVFKEEPTIEQLEDFLKTKFTSAEYENLLLGEVVNKGNSFYILEIHYL